MSFDTIHVLTPVPGFTQYSPCVMDGWRTIPLSLDIQLFAVLGLVALGHLSPDIPGAVVYFLTPDVVGRIRAVEPPGRFVWVVPFLAHNILRTSLIVKNSLYTFL